MTMLKSAQRISKREGKKVQVSFGNIEEVLKSLINDEIECRFASIEATGMIVKGDEPGFILTWVESEIQKGIAKKFKAKKK